VKPRPAGPRRIRDLPAHMAVRPAPWILARRGGTKPHARSIVLPREPPTGHGHLSTARQPRISDVLALLVGQATNKNAAGAARISKPSLLRSCATTQCAAKHGSHVQRRHVFWTPTFFPCYCSVMAMDAVACGRARLVVHARPGFGVRDRFDP